MKQTRNFDEWLSTMTDTVADWTYYTDFPKVYKNVSSIKVALNIMNSLIGSKNIQEDFLRLISKLSRNFESCASTYC